MGSYSFSEAAYTANGENLMVIRDARVAVANRIEAPRIFDQYHFRQNQLGAQKAKKKLELIIAPLKARDIAWREKDFTE